MHANRIYRKNKKMFDLIRTFFLNLKKSCEIRNNIGHADIFLDRYAYTPSII